MQVVEPFAPRFTFALTLPHPEQQDGSAPQIHIRTLPQTFRFEGTSRRPVAAAPVQLLNDVVSSMTLVTGVGLLGCTAREG